MELLGQSGDYEQYEENRVQMVLNNAIDTESFDICAVFGFHRTPPRMYLSVHHIPPHMKEHLQNQPGEHKWNKNLIHQPDQEYERRVPEARFIMREPGTRKVIRSTRMASPALLD